MSKHTPTPWSIELTRGGYFGGKHSIKAGELWLGHIYFDDISDGVNYEDNIAFIVRAVNSHESLIETLKKIDHGLSLLDQVKFGAMRLAIYRALKLAETGE